MQKSTGWQLFLRAMAARAYPRIWGTSRELSWIFFEIVIPLINTVAFVYLYKALHAPEAFIGFVILGGVMATYWLNVLWMMASQLYWDKQEGTHKNAHAAGADVHGGPAFIPWHSWTAAFSLIPWVTRR